MDDLADDLVHLHPAVLDNVAGMEFVVVDTENVNYVIFLSLLLEYISTTTLMDK